MAESTVWEYSIFNERTFAGENDGHHRRAAPGEAQKLLEAAPRVPFDGDLVVVQKNAPTRVGDIVVAVVDGQVTVKHLRQQPDGRFYLQAANPAFADILPTGELEILGVVVGSFRSYRR